MGVNVLYMGKIKTGFNREEYIYRQTRLNGVRWMKGNDRWIQCCGGILIKGVLSMQVDVYKGLDGVRWS